MLNNIKMVKEVKTLIDLESEAFKCNFIVNRLRAV
jgi:hypothetical protein